MIPALPHRLTVPPVWVVSPDDPSNQAYPEGLPRSGAGTGILRGKRVIIIEDEAITQIQLRKICLTAGMQVAGVAADGEQGVQKVLQTRPDIVLLDINLPVLDGLSAAERFLQELSTCVVILTAYDGEEYQKRSQALGACGYIVKPVTASTLLPKLELAFQQFQTRPQ